MAEIQYSENLQALLKYAVTIGKNIRRQVSAEQVFLAALDWVDGKVTFFEGSEKMMVEVWLRRMRIDREVMRRELTAFIDAQHVVPFLDEHIMMRYRHLAEEACLRRGRDEITVRILLECMSNEPSEGLKPYFKGVRSDGKVLRPDEKEEQREVVVDEVDEEIPVVEEDPDANLSPMERTAKLTAFVRDVHRQLSETVFGQDAALDVFASGLFKFEMKKVMGEETVKPCTFLFAGPPGVGKTLLAESAKTVLGRPFMRFDMSEYCDKEAALEFCGSDKVYRNGKKGNFTSFIEANPSCIVLFDEIEKAHLTIIHLFLQMLDAGRIRDNYTDEELSLKNVIMIFTTNAGRQLYNEAESGDFSAVSRKVILNALKKDVDPLTKRPFFPEAICSRFAAGNVVMFNRMSAETLHAVAKKNVLEQMEQSKQALNVSFEIDERLYPALMFSEGGEADARTVSNRAKGLFNGEMYELYRLVDAEEGFSVDAIKTVRFTVDPSAEEVSTFFAPKVQMKALVLASPNVAKACTAAMKMLCAETAEQAEAMIREKDVQVLFVETAYGKKDGGRWLDAQDVDSEARRLLQVVKEKYPDLPVCLLQPENEPMSSEEKRSFARFGMGRILTVDATLKERIGEVCRCLHWQNSMRELASANKLISFETAQRLNEDGTEAEICLFDFKLSTAVDAEDADSVLNGRSRPTVRWSDVIGAEDAKRELEYFAEYLRNPKKFVGTGVRPPRGVLLYGPPGTGKTMLAKAMAGETNVTFISAEGNQFLTPSVGEGSERVHSLFRMARKYAPAVLFIDEIDAIGKERLGVRSGEETLTAFLTEMDGFKTDTSKPVFVLAATNFEVRPGTSKSLDPALLRRFDRRICIDLPGREERLKYLKKEIAKNKLFVVDKKFVNNLAARAAGMSLAEIESALELSLRMAIREKTMQVTDTVLEEAFEAFRGGERKLWDDKTLERVARHEAGHALVSILNGDIPSHITVISRGNMGGYVQSGSENKGMYSRRDLLDKIEAALGGRAAEMLYYGEDGITTSASADLKHATELARWMVVELGMDSEFGLAVDSQEGMSREVREKVNAILNEQLQRALAVLRENRAAIDRLVKKLIAKNYLSGDEAAAVVKE